MRICGEALDDFGDGAHKENASPYPLRIGESRRSIGINFERRTTNAKGERIAWSAAFVSHVLAKAGAGARFPGAAGRYACFQHFVSAAPRAPRLPPP